MGDAIRREKQLKNWHRQWKFNLTWSVNPYLRDLTEDLFPDADWGDTARLAAG